MTATLNIELQLVERWVARNKFTLNISKTKSIVLGTKHSQNLKPQLNLVINNVEIKQIEMTKLLGLTLDCKLSRSKHIDTVVAKMGSSLSIIKLCSAFLTLSTRQVLQALLFSRVVRSHKKGLRKIAIGSEQGSTVGPWMYTES
jgi:hypothetical protein